MKEKIIGLVICLIFILSSFAGVTNAYNIEKSKENIKTDEFKPIINLNKEQNKNLEKIRLTDEQINEINTAVNNIKNPLTKKRLKNILNKIISEENILDMKELISVSRGFYDTLLDKTGIEIVCKVCDNVTDIPKEVLGTTIGGSVKFSPPYNNCNSWGDGTDLLDDYSDSCNKYSGAIGAYASGFVGGATAEAHQIITFYVGKTKTIDVDAEIIYVGGGNTVGIGAFAGTEKTWYRDTHYGRSDLDFWLSWDRVLFLILDFVSLIAPGTPDDIKEAIELLGLIGDFGELFDSLHGLVNSGDAEEKHISFSFSASPGWHTISAGLRATASGCVTGTGVSVAAGQVVSITLDGIGAPSKPSVSGPYTGVENTLYEFCAKSNDPNGDRIKYKFDWGDGEVSSWSNYRSSGSRVCKDHKYAEDGAYTITVYAKDIDDMDAIDVGTHTIEIGEVPDGANLRCEGSFTWLDVGPDETVTGIFTVENMGNTGTLLDWEVSDYPSWGEWNFDPSSGENLKYEDGKVTVDVTVVAPREMDGYFDGIIRVENKWDHNDYYELGAVLTTPKNKMLSNHDNIMFRFFRESVFYKIINNLF